MRCLVELSGESEELAGAEALAAARVMDPGAGMTEGDGRALVLSGDIEPAALASRLGLAWSVCAHVVSCDTVDEMRAALGNLELPGSTFRVRVRDLGMSRGDTKGLAGRLGQVLATRYRVALEDPEVELRVLASGRLHAGILAGEVDRSGMEARRSEKRPFNHPISLHPKFARALVNLAGGGTGRTVLDPFCGTGGILLEAGLMGCRVLGGDIDTRMVAGARRNLAHFGVGDADIRQADISDWPEIVAREDMQVHALATDPPYGRSASTAREPVAGLYGRMFSAASQLLKPGGRMAVVLPDPGHAESGRKGGMELLGMYPVRVHRSLTRYFCVFRKA